MAKRVVIGKGVVEYVARATYDDAEFGTAVGIGLEQDGAIIAGVAYVDFNGVNIVCHIASDGSRQWMSREYLDKIFDYPFRQLQVKRITVLVAQSNADSRRFVEHLGFYEEARLRDAHPDGDLIVYAMRRDDCRFIGESNGKERFDACPS